jgi:hypothetical protein
MAKLEINLPELADTMLALCQSTRSVAESTDKSASPLTDPEQICAGLNRFADIIRHLDQQAPLSPEQPPPPSSANEFQELSDFGLDLLNQLGDWCDQLELTDTRQALDEVIVTLGVWAARNLGPLHTLEPIVNALSKVANSTTDPAFLAELSHVYREIVDAVAPTIKQDIDKSNPGRPWRILNLNYAIVATRSHQADIMEQAFEQLLIRLPEDAAGFFREGLQQMDIIGYPDHVRRVMEKFFQLTNNPTLH